MEKIKKTEYIILIILWIGMLSTFIYAVLNNYQLFNSDYFGFIGLSVVTIIAFMKPEKTLGGLLILLLLGLFNLVSFVYFINVVFTFRFTIVVSPGIQMTSLILLTILVIKKRDKIGEIYRKTFIKTEEQKEQTRQNQKNRFKKKFEKLTYKEIESRLELNLVPEAIEALKEIKKEREDILQH